MNCIVPLNRLITSLLFLCVTCSCYSQSDSATVLSLLRRANNALRIKPDTALNLSRKAFIISNKTNYNDGIINSLLCLGRAYNHKNISHKSLYFFNEALKTSKRFSSEIGEAKSHLALGQLYDLRSSYGRALVECFEAIKLFENLNMQNGINQCNTLLSHIYYNQQNYNKAKVFLLKVKDTQQQMTNVEKHTYYINLGAIYHELMQSDSAIYFFTRALKTQEELQNRVGVADAQTNIGNVFHAQKNYDKALEYYNEALKVYKYFNIEYFMGINYLNIGDIYLTKHRYKEAEEYLLKGLKLAVKSEDLEGLKLAFLNLASLYEQTKQFEKANHYNSKYIGLKDSLMDQQHQNQINDVITANETYKKDREIKILNSATTIKEQIIEKQNTRTLFLIFSLMGMLVFIAYIVLSLREKKRNNDIIINQKIQVEKQKSIIEQKNKDITDSINYASRLQKAIVPASKLVMEHLPQSFVIFKPKDIVAGDFYWMETLEYSDIQSRSDHKLVLLAAADCTGHGVPGAMLSLICSNALNRAVKEFHLIDPGKILDKVRELVIETFEKSETEVKDGMDISLCAISTLNHTLKWAGANNPLWLIRKNNEPLAHPVLKEINPTKQPIGIVENPVPFETHTLQLNHGDMLYLFTDGFADQFGGPDGKKYKYSKFRKLLLSLHRLSMMEQKNAIERDFLDWKSFNEQVDDVCVIGIRV